MFNNGETGQTRTARGVIHNNYTAFRVFPFRVPLPMLHPTQVCGSSVLSFLRFLGFPVLFQTLFPPRCGFGLLYFCCPSLPRISLLSVSVDGVLCPSYLCWIPSA